MTHFLLINRQGITVERGGIGVGFSTRWSVRQAKSGYLLVAFVLSIAFSIHRSKFQADYSSRTCTSNQVSKAPARGQLHQLHNTPLVRSEQSPSIESKRSEKAVMLWPHVMLPQRVGRCVSLSLLGYQLMKRLNRVRISATATPPTTALSVRDCSAVIEVSSRSLGVIALPASRAEYAGGRRRAPGTCRCRLQVEPARVRPVPIVAVPRCPLTPVERAHRRYVRGVLPLPLSVRQLEVTRPAERSGASCWNSTTPGAVSFDGLRLANRLRVARSVALPLLVPSHRMLPATRHIPQTPRQTAREAPAVRLAPRSYSLLESSSYAGLR